MFPSTRGSLSKEEIINDTFVDMAPSWLFVLRAMICSQSAITANLPTVISNLLLCLQDRNGPTAILLPYLIDNYYGAFILFKNRPGLPAAILVVDGFQKKRDFSHIMQQLLTHFITQLGVWGLPVIKKTWGLLKTPHEFTYEANRFSLFITRIEQLFGYLDQSMRGDASIDSLIHKPEIVSFPYNRSLRLITVKILAFNAQFQTPLAAGVDTSWYDDPKVNKLAMLSWRSLSEQNPVKAHRAVVFPVQPLNFYGNIVPDIASLPNLNTAFIYTNDLLPYEIPKFTAQLEKRISDFDLLIFPLIVAAETKEFEKLNQHTSGQVCNHYALVVLRKLQNGQYEFYYQCPLGESSFYSDNKKLALCQFSKFFQPVSLVKKETRLTTQQNNGYDCGVWLILNIEHALASNWDETFGNSWPQEFNIVDTRELHNALVTSLR
jgi:hypothetical protein